MIDWGTRRAESHRKGDGGDGGRRWLGSFRTMDYGSPWAGCSLRCIGLGWAVAAAIGAHMWMALPTTPQRETQRLRGRRTDRPNRTGAVTQGERRHDETQPLMAHGAVRCRDGERVHLTPMPRCQSTILPRPNDRCRSESRKGELTRIHSRITPEGIDGKTTE